MPRRNHTGTDVSTACMILGISTVALKKEIALEPNQLRPRIPLDHNITVEIQGPVEGLETEPAEQIHLDPIPDLEFTRPKRRQANLTPVFHRRILVANTRDSFPSKKDIGILVATNNTESPRHLCLLLKPLAQIQRIQFIAARGHRPNDSLLFNKRSNIHLFVKEILIAALQTNPMTRT